ncbi:MAG: DUF7664 domain-containing protein [Streptosporangiaceae bacterium]
MASKYDTYWAAQLDEIRAALGPAVTGAPATVAVPGLRRLGARQSWYGVCEVHGRQVTRSSMAHAASLGRTAAASGICVPWPEVTFRFTITTAGILTITNAGHGSTRSRRPTDRVQSPPAGDTHLLDPGALPAPRPDDRQTLVRSGDRYARTSEFYCLLEELAAREHGPRRLAGCTGAEAWPGRGVYFFYENGEIRGDGSGRVVRVGTHALTATSRSTLWGRLRQHRGYLAGTHPGGGNHRASVFRRHVGSALIQRGNYPGELLASWLDRRRPPELRAPQEHEIELKVSRYIGAMPFLWLAVPDRPDGTSDRGYIERNSIALLSRLTGAADQPSTGWLGQDASSPRVRQSGLWNSDYVDDRYDSGFLQVLAALVKLMP